MWSKMINKMISKVTLKWSFVHKHHWIYEGWKLQPYGMGLETFAYYRCECGVWAEQHPGQAYHLKGKPKSNPCVKIVSKNHALKSLRRTFKEPHVGVVNAMNASISKEVKR